MATPAAAAMTPMIRLSRQRGLSDRVMTKVPSGISSAFILGLGSWVPARQMPDRVGVLYMLRLVSDLTLSAQSLRSSSLSGMRPLSAR